MMLGAVCTCRRLFVYLVFYLAEIRLKMIKKVVLGLTKMDISAMFSHRYQNKKRSKYIKKELEMNKAEYHDQLKRLPIYNPTLEDMALLCPHLSKKEAVQAFMTGSGDVACPSLVVVGSFHVLRFIEEGPDTMGKICPAMIYHVTNLRTPRSYTDGCLHGDLTLTAPYQDKAMAFAEANWGEDLTVVDWKYAVEIWIADPLDIVRSGLGKMVPKLIGVVYIAVNRDWSDSINDRVKQTSEVIDDAITRITTDSIIGEEITMKRAFTEFNCAHCGGGHLLSCCTGCGKKFEDGLMRTGWYTPLPKKAVAYLREQGHVFGVDPEVARAKEKELYEKQQAERALMARNRAL